MKVIASFLHVTMAQPLLEPPRHVYGLDQAERQSGTVVNKLWKWCERLVTYLNRRFTYDGARTLMDQRLRQLEMRADEVDQANNHLRRDVTWLTSNVLQLLDLTKPKPPVRSVPV